MELVILVGLQASGKSTFFETRLASTHVQVSKDLWKTGNRGRRQVREIDAALQAGRSVVVDNTNPAVADRADIIRQGREYGAKIVGYYFRSVYAECAVRNAERPRQVPDVAFRATMKRLQTPSFEEGFDQLFYVRLAAAGFDILPWEGTADGARPV